MPHDILFEFLLNFKRNLDISYLYFFMLYTAWLVNINNSVAAVLNMLATSKSCGKTCCGRNQGREIFMYML